MRINKVDHLAINTKDIEESVAFYSNMLGFKETKRVDMGSCILVYMEIFAGSYLELFDFKGNSIPENTGHEDVAGLRHIAFDVSDINAWNTALKVKKAEFVMELTRMEPLREDGLLIRDPNGVIIELCSAY